MPAKIEFHAVKSLDDTLLTYAVVLARYRQSWLLVRNRERTTFEMPGGGREDGESIFSAATRELREETAASEFKLTPLTAYSVTDDVGDITYGVFYYAEVFKLGDELVFETAEVAFCDQLPDAALLTYPEILPVLFDHGTKQIRLLLLLEKYDHVIWDWNGTLVDDVDHAIAAIGEVLKKNGKTAIDKAHYRQIFKFPIRQYYQDLGFELSQVSFDSLCDDFISSYDRHVKSAALFPHTQFFLELIGSRCCQSILSASHENQLISMVKGYQIDHHFDHIFGIGDYYAASKLERGKELIAKAGVCPTKTILVGDTDHDAEVASQLGIDFLIVADGHQAFDRLQHRYENVLASRYE